MLKVIFISLFFLIPFVLFNYPYGKIFLGDLGAYSLGLIISIFVVVLLGRHPNLPIANAILILIYPITEVIFTIGRRLLRGVSIFRPDIEHLHLKLFYFFKPMPNFNKIANALVAPVLSLFWLFPLIFIPWVYQRTVFIIIAVSLFILIYLMFYIVLLNLDNQKNKIN